MPWWTRNEYLTRATSKIFTITTDKVNMEEGDFKLIEEKNRPIYKRLKKHTNEEKVDKKDIENIFNEIERRSPISTLTESWLISSVYKLTELVIYPMVKIIIGLY